MVHVSTKYLDLSADWARAAYALICLDNPKTDIEPSSVMQMLRVLVDHKLGGQIRGAVKSHGSLFEYHREIVEGIYATVDALMKEAPKRTTMFKKLGESYLAALSNGDAFIVPDEYVDIEFTNPVSDETCSGEPKRRLPKKVIDEWRDATMAQMELDGVDNNLGYSLALDENMLTVMANFGHMTQRQFDDEANEPKIEAFLNNITGEPHITIAQYMRQAI